jgi:hypothetical protein
MGMNLLIMKEEFAIFELNSKNLYFSCMGIITYNLLGTVF